MDNLSNQSLEWQSSDEKFHTFLILPHFVECQPPGSILPLFHAITSIFWLTFFTFGNILCLICLKFICSFQVKGTCNSPQKHASAWGMNVLIQVALQVTLKYLKISVTVSKVMEGMSAPRFWIAIDCERKVD